jgi:hypothetical protein
VYQSGAGTITVSGLDAATAYTFTVTATNEAGTSIPTTPSASVTTGYALGSTGPGGGKVFYVSTAGFTSTGSACGNSCHYLEARAIVGELPWCPELQKVSGTFGTAIGNGYSNTQLMVNGCKTGAGIAARATSGGLSDWFLPSKDELRALWQQRDLVGGWPLMGHATWWSSSQASQESGYGTQWTYAWAQDRSYTGEQDIVSKAFSFVVRPIRAF